MLGVAESVHDFKLLYILMKRWNLKVLRGVYAGSQNGG
jgi:hypothetical protein